MSQHDMTVDNGAGLAVRADINLALKALASQSSGATAPSPTFPCQIWADTGTSRLWRRNSANTAWLDMGPIDTGLQDSGRLLNIQTFTASGTYTKTAGTKKIYVEGQAAGGGGGGTQATSASQAAAGAGGSAGSFGKGLYDATGFTTQTVTIGAAGVGAAGVAGTNASSSSFGALMTLPGGLGGGLGAAQSSFANAGATGGLPGSLPTGANVFNSAGDGGTTGAIYQTSSATAGIGGRPYMGASSLTANGSGYGYGGSGARATASAGANNGFNGGPAIFIVWEFS